MEKFGVTEWIGFVFAFELYSVLFTVVSAIVLSVLGVRIKRIVLLGIGPKLGSFKFRGVPCEIGWIPIGGYVEHAYGEEERSFSRLPAAQKVLSGSAGVLTIFLVGLSLLAVSWMLGRTEPAFLHGAAEVGWCRPGSPLTKAGLIPGYTVLAVEHSGARVPVSSWRDLLRDLTWVDGENVGLVCACGPETTLVTASMSDSLLFDISHEGGALVAAVISGSDAERAGFLSGDAIVSVAGQATIHWSDVLMALAKCESEIPSTGRAGIAEQTADVEVTRDGDRLLLGFPVVEDLGRIEAFGLRPVEQSLRTIQLGLRASLMRALAESVEISRLAKRFVFRQREFSPEIPSHFVNSNGYRRLIASQFSAGGSRFVVVEGLMGVLLTLFNLLPLPSLAGGEIMLASIEFIRGRPSSQLVTNIVTNVGALVLMLLYFVLGFRAVKAIFFT